jgi:hypothetical protein
MSSSCQSHGRRVRSLPSRATSEGAAMATIGTRAMTRESVPGRFSVMPLPIEGTARSKLPGCSPVKSRRGRIEISTPGCICQNLRQVRHDHPVDKKRPCHDTQRAAGPVMAHLFDRPGNRPEPFRQCRCQQRARLRQADPSAAPDGEADPQFRFQRTHLLGHRRMGDVQRPGRVRKAAMASGRLERTKRSERWQGFPVGQHDS